MVREPGLFPNCKVLVAAAGRIHAGLIVIIVCDSKDSIPPEMCHTVIWDVQYCKIRLKYRIHVEYDCILKQF